MRTIVFECAVTAFFLVCSPTRAEPAMCQAEGVAPRAGGISTIGAVPITTPTITAKLVRIPGGAVLSVAAYGFQPGESVVIRPWGVDVHGHGAWLLPPVKLIADSRGAIHWVGLLSFPGPGDYSIRITVQHSGSTAHPVPVRDTG